MLDNKEKIPPAELLKRTKLLLEIAAKVFKGFCLIITGKCTGHIFPHKSQEIQCCISTLGYKNPSLSISIEMHFWGQTDAQAEHPVHSALIDIETIFIILSNTYQLKQTNRKWLLNKSHF